MDDSELLIFGAITAQKAQVIGAPSSIALLNHLPFNCILVRVAVPAETGVPEPSLDMSNLFIFNIVFVFADPDKDIKEVAPLNPEVILPVA